MARLDTLRVVGIPETNRVMAGEASRIAVRSGAGRVKNPKKAGTGTLIYPYDEALAAALTIYHRTSSRILRDLYSSSATRLEPLHDELYAAAVADDRPWCADGVRLAIRARNVSSFESRPGQLLGAVKRAVFDGLAERGIQAELDTDNPDLLLALRQHDSELTVSLDLTGTARHKRGYRQDAGLAPLRENLAAVLVMLTRWDARTEPLIDPMSGSGTIAIEAALLGRGVAAFPEGVSEPLFGDTEPVIMANELQTKMMDSLRGNVARAGCESAVTTHHGNAMEWPPERVRTLLAKRGATGPGVILCNPPYGERLNTPDMEGLYRDFGTWCAQFPGYRVGVLCAHPDFERAFGRSARVTKPLSNGSQRATFYLFDM